MKEMAHIDISYKYSKIHMDDRNLTLFINYNTCLSSCNIFRFLKVYKILC